MHSRPVYNTCCRICGNRDSAADILQEVFSAAFKKLEQFDPSRSFKSWLQGIAINMSLNWVRNEKRQLLSSAEVLDVPDENDSLTYESDVTYSVERIIQELNKLSWIQQMVFTLHTLEELTHKDIAFKLSVPESTVRSHYIRAKKQILKQLSNHGTTGGIHQGE